ncbi:hypothetical protein NEISUBOT_04863 [Neisseria subflava NJ9703]|uniref:Uncharacterized protein n=1 Tax=Neisseria subflava NJ9703 TaxID=546268 RepID=A0A9W5IQ84_NEISU|nr:hypothetical protein NEISUBOT_04863 [Neisseria subflava NJ9703]
MVIPYWFECLRVSASRRRVATVLVAAVSRKVRTKLSLLVLCRNARLLQ